MAGKTMKNTRKSKKNTTRKNYKKSNSKKGLTKTEKKEVKEIVASRKEFRYTERWINYDNYDPALVSTYQQPMLTATTTIPNVYDANNGTATIIGMQTGFYLNTASTQLDTNFTAAGQQPFMKELGGYGMPNTTTSTGIDGRYAYMHSGQVTLQINSIVASGNGGTVNDAISPLCFRVLHVRAKKDAAGITPSLGSDLLRNMVNKNTGLMGSMTLRQLMTDFSVNRERFQVVHDKKFKLSEPVQPNYAGSSANQPIRNLPYPTQKTLKLWLDKPKKKLRFAEDDNNITNQFEPLNYDFVNYIFVICCREQTTNGEYSSTLKRWTCTTQGQTKYRDC